MVAIAKGEESHVRRSLRDEPELAAMAIERDASRTDPAPPVLQQLSCYLYQGDTALHIAAAADRPAVAALLLGLGADVDARNRRGATSLHHAASGSPARPEYDPQAQSDTITLLLTAGADVEAINMDGTTPLHRAIRARCSAAVEVLLDAGASPIRTNGHGSTPLQIAQHASGRGGTGRAVAKAEQAAIIRLLSAAVDG